MNLNANSSILPHISELLNILLTFAANRHWNSQAEIGGEVFTCYLCQHNTIPIWSYRYQLRPHAKAFWNTHIQLMKQVVMGFHFSQIFYMCMEYKRQYWKFLLFFLVQQCSRYSILLCFFVPCRDGLYHILLSITKEAQSSSFHKQI